MSKRVENFCKSLFEPNWWHAGKQDLECSREWQFCSSFYAFTIKEETPKEDYLKAGGRKQGGGNLYDWITG